MSIFLPQEYGTNINEGGISFCFGENNRKYVELFLFKQWKCWVVIVNWVFTQSYSFLINPTQADNISQAVTMSDILFHWWLYAFFPLFHSTVKLLVLYSHDYDITCVCPTWRVSPRILAFLSPLGWEPQYISQPPLLQLFFLYSCGLENQCWQY